MRVIGGVAKGTRLVAPSGRATRPMTDRIKEALFSTLGRRVTGYVLDLYAGSGSLGIEALSRGADAAYFVDVSPEALRCVERNLEASGLASKGRLYRSDVMAFLKRCAREDLRFDLAFVDPPYSLADAAVFRVLEALFPLLEPGGTVCLHRESARLRSSRAEGALVGLPSGYRPLFERSYGGSTIVVAERGELDEASAGN